MARHARLEESSTAPIQWLTQGTNVMRSRILAACYLHAFYGEAFSDDPGLYDRFKAPLLMIRAKADTEPTPALLRDIEKELLARKQSAPVVEIDAAHGFAEPAHPNYNQATIDAAWGPLLGFLQARVQEGCR
jgi:dienelactone hydrolase